ncbi:hypothetical protein PROFUN_17164, partial [Planoprotostelium fungivorum]
MSAQAPPVAAYAVDSDSEEEDGELHIYDDCNEIRRKIKAMLAQRNWRSELEFISAVYESQGTHGR